MNMPENLSISQLIFGANIPLLEAELNEMQYASRQGNIALLRALYHSGLIFNTTYTEGNSDLTIANGVAIVSGKVVFLKPSTVVTFPAKPGSGTKTYQVILECWDELTRYTQNLYQYGEFGGTVVTNYLQDSRLAQESTKRIQQLYRIRVVEAADVTNIHPLGSLGAEATEYYAAVTGHTNTYAATLASPGNIEGTINCTRLCTLVLNTTTATYSNQIKQGGTLTSSELLSSLTDVDGTGSGLDADKLDGQEGSYYLAWANLTSKPSSTVANIDSAVTNSHTHSNKATLDTYTQTEVNLADAVTKKHASGSDNQNLFSHIHVYSTGTTDVTNSPHTVDSQTDHLQLLQGTNITITMDANGIVTVASPAYGTAAGTVCQGNDSRLSDARTPANHNLIDTTKHPVSGLTAGHFVRASGATAYAFAAIQAADLPTGIDAAKIGNGSVTSAEFQYLANVTSDIQTQLNGKASTMTASELLTSIKTVDGASSGLDADLLDGNEASSFVRKDIAQTMAAILTAQNNTSYTTFQVRNICASTANPSGGNNGDIWAKYIA